MSPFVGILLRYTPSHHFGIFIFLTYIYSRGMLYHGVIHICLEFSVGILSIFGKRIALLVSSLSGPVQFTGMTHSVSWMCVGLIVCLDWPASFLVVHYRWLVFPCAHHLHLLWLVCHTICVVCTEKCTLLCLMWARDTRGLIHYTTFLRSDGYVNLEKKWNVLFVWILLLKCILFIHLIHPLFHSSIHISHTMGACVYCQLMSPIITLMFTKMY